MKGVELYGRVRYAVRIEGLSEPAAARRHGIIRPQKVTDAAVHVGMTVPVCVNG